MVSSCLLQTSYAPSDCREHKAHHIAHPVLSSLVESSSIGHGVDFRCLFTQVQDIWRLWARYCVAQACLCCVTELSPFFPSLPIGDACMHALGHHNMAVQPILPNPDDKSDPTLLLLNAGKKNTRQTIIQWNWRHNITEKESGRGNILTSAGPPLFSHRISISNQINYLIQFSAPSQANSILYLSPSQNKSFHL